MPPLFYLQSVIVLGVVIIEKMQILGTLWMCSVGYNAKNISSAAVKLEKPHLNMLHVTQ